MSGTDMAGTAEAAGTTRRRLLGVDVGGTKIAAGVVTADGVLLACIDRPTPAAEGREAVLNAIVETVTALPGWKQATGLGIGTGGVVDRRRGVVVSANDLLPGWAGTAIGAELTARLGGLPVAADNDANVFALAEQTYGAGAGSTTALYVSVGTGIGGGLVTGGRLLRGAHCTAGELGHMAVPEAAGRACNCGRTGHLEAVASGPAITARFCELAACEQVRDLREVSSLAAEAAAHGTAGHAARTALEEGARALGRALAGLVNALDPERVVVGGGVASMGDLYWRPLTEAFTAELLPGPADAGMRPVPAALGARAAVVGAAALLLEEPHADPLDRRPTGDRRPRRSDLT